MELSQLITLCRYGWAIPILAALGSGVSPRYHALKFHLKDASRDAISDSIEHLIILGLIVRSLGHGHPLRPDFQLTESGDHVAKIAMVIWRNAQICEAQKFVRLRWGLPLLHILQAPMSFGHIKECLQPITDRALSLILKQGQAEHFISRSVVTTTYPPATLYAPLSKVSVLYAALVA